MVGLENSRQLLRAFSKVGQNRFCSCTALKRTRRSFQQAGFLPQTAWLRWFRQGVASEVQAGDSLSAFQYASMVREAIIPRAVSSLF